MRCTWATSFSDPPPRARTTGTPARETTHRRHCGTACRDDDAMQSASPPADPVPTTTVLVVASAMTSFVVHVHPHPSTKIIGRSSTCHSGSGAAGPGGRRRTCIDRIHPVHSAAAASTIIAPISLDSGSWEHPATHQCGVYPVAIQTMMRSLSNVPAPLFSFLSHFISSRLCLQHSVTGKPTSLFSQLAGTPSRGLSG
jgi:hypothetical protein